MSIYLLDESSHSNATLTDRLSQLISLVPVEMKLIEKLVNKGDVLLASGNLLDRMESNRGVMLEDALRRGIHILVHPPLPPLKIDWRIPQVDATIFQAADYSPVKIVNQSLSEIVGNRDFSILYNMSIVSGPGRPIATSSRGEVVVASFQHRSNWGILACTTLLLGSSSIRSARAERSAFLQGLIQWLISYSSPDLSIIKEDPKKISYSDFEISILLIALFLSYQDGQVNKDYLVQKVGWIQTKLQIQNSNIQVEKGLKELELLKITTEKDAILSINLDQLTQEINKRRLWSYLRRLK